MTTSALAILLVEDLREITARLDAFHVHEHAA